MVDLSRCLRGEMEGVSLVEVKNHSRMPPVGLRPRIAVLRHTCLDRVLWLITG